MSTFSKTLSAPWPPCVVGTVSTKENWTDMRTRTPECHLLEWRIDLLLEDLSLEEILSPPDISLPVLATIRTSEEGGAGNLSHEKRKELYIELLSLAVNSSIVALDIEVAYLSLFREVIDLARQKDIFIIGSAHNFKNTFSEEAIRSIDKQGTGNGADLIKIAHTLNSPEDILTGTHWLRRKKERKEPAALMGMGLLGPVSRLLYSQLGSKLLYGYMGDSPTAPGQLPVSDFYGIADYLLPFEDK